MMPTVQPSPSWLGLGRGTGPQTTEVAERESAYSTFRRVPMASTTIRQSA